MLSSRHAGDVDRLRLDVEVDDEIFGAFVGHSRVVERVAGGVGQARVLQLGRVGHEHVLAGGQAGQEGQVDLAGVGEDVSCRSASSTGVSATKFAVAMNCDSFCVVLA